MPDLEDEPESVIVPDCICPISQDDYNDLERNISPSATSMNYGMDLYSSVLAFVEERL